MILILALVLGLAGSYLLYRSWKRHSAMVAILGWGCLLATLPLWVVSIGPEYGTIFAISLPAIYVWIGIISEQKPQPTGKAIVKPYMAISWQGNKVAKNAGYVFYHLILLMLVSGVLATAFADLIPATRPAQLATGILTLPLIWAVLSFWHLISGNKRVPLLFSLLSTVAASIYLFVSP